jgi:hypothetical protein
MGLRTQAANAGGGGKQTLSEDFLRGLVTTQFQFVPRLFHGRPYERHGAGSFPPCL